MPASDSFKAIGLKLFSVFLFVIMAATLRHLGREDYPLGELAFLRAFLAMLVVLAFYAWRGDLPGALKTKRIGGHIVRGSFAATGIFLFIAAYTRLPVVEVTAIGFLAPLITVVFAAVFLRERVRTYRWSAVFVGFIGAMVMVAPYLGVTAYSVTDEMISGAIFAVLNAFCSAGAATQIRRLQETETTASIVFSFCLAASLAGLMTLPFGWHMPQTSLEVLLLALLGLSGGVGQIMNTASFRYASPSMLAPFDYTAMIWAFLIGYFFFGELPTVYLITGAVIITGAGLFVIWRESRLGLKRAREITFAAAIADADTLPDKSDELVKKP